VALSIPDGISAEKLDPQVLLSPSWPSTFNRDLPRLNIGFRGFLFSDVKNLYPHDLLITEFPTHSLRALAPPGYNPSPYD